LASIANEICRVSRPMRPPCVVIASGETTVAIRGHTGKGGPSQELALAAAPKIAGRRIVLASIDTDGTDGPTTIAGGIVDGNTLARAHRRNLDLFKALTNHESSKALTKLGDAIRTGPTETNVMDLNIVIVRK